MQEVLGFPDDLIVSHPTAVVTVGGVSRDFESISVSSELESAMPSQVAISGGAVVASTGDVSLLPDDSVVTSGDSPWTSSLPDQGNRVSVEVGYGGANAKVFTGVLDSASGSPSNAGVAVGLIDEVDRLDRRISIPPLLNAAPSLTEGDWTFRRAGLSPIYFTDRILRHCGYRATPQTSGRPVFSAPMMGSAWPEIGTLVTASAATNSGSSVAFRETHWGMGVANATASYSPSLSGVSGALTSAFQMVFCKSAHTSMSQTAVWTVFWGSDGLRVDVTSLGDVTARLVVGGVESVGVSMPAATANLSDTFTVRWLPDGSVTIYSSNGDSVSGTVSYPASITSSPITSIGFLLGGQTWVLGGFQASFSQYDAHLEKRTAVLTPPALAFGLQASPFIDDRSCADLLKEQAEAELAAMWLDEFGVFRWVNREVLMGSAPAGTLTSQDDLLDLPWELPTKSVFSSVVLNSNYPTVTRRAKGNLTLWRGSGSTLENLDEDSQFIEPPADETWGMVSWPPVRAAAADATALKWGRGSYFGGVVAEDEQADRWATASELSQTASVMGAQKWLIKSTVSVSSTRSVEQRMLENTTYRSQSGQNLPVVRGKWKATWEERSTVGAYSGPSTAPVLNHPVGWWVQDEAELQSLADWIAERVTVSQPLIRDVPIVPDPRIQKGDVFWLEDTYAYHVRLKVLVMGINLTVNAGPPVVMEQSITCRIIEAQRVGVSLSEHDAVWAGETLDAQDLFWAGKTLTQHDADPLAH